jgi:hypothetical protein
MWFVVSKKEHHRVLESWGHAEYESRQEIEDKDAILASTEREKVLTDLQAALNLIRGYQRSLSIASYSDPQIIEANALLEKYGMKGDANATYLGFQQKGAVRAPHKDHVELDALLDVPLDRPKTRWEREEEEYGEESYGKGNVRIEAMAIDEGEDKEPGYTRAHIRFVDLGADPDALTHAKEAGWSPPDDEPPSLDLLSSGPLWLLSRT